MAEDGALTLADTAALTFFSEAGEAPRLSALLAGFAPVAQSLGFTAAACFYVARPGEPIAFRLAFSWSLPQGDLRRLQQRLSATDPVVQGILMSPRAAAWPHDGADAGSATWLIPVHGPMGETLCVAALGQAVDDLSDSRRMTLQLAATLLANRGVVLAEIAAETSSVSRPTPRETECAKLAAKGKTDWEIGQILGVAEGTVAFHLESLKAKLKVARRSDISASLARVGDLAEDDG